MSPWRTDFNQKVMWPLYRSNAFRSCHHNQFYITVLEPFVALYETVLLAEGYIYHPPWWLTCFGSCAVQWMGTHFAQWSSRYEAKLECPTFKYMQPWINEVTWYNFGIFMGQHCVRACERERDTEREREKDRFWLFFPFPFSCWLGVIIFEEHTGSPAFWHPSAKR